MPTLSLFNPTESISFCWLTSEVHWMIINNELRQQPGSTHIPLAWDTYALLTELTSPPVKHSYFLAHSFSNNIFCKNFFTKVVWKFKKIVLKLHQCSEWMIIWMLIHNFSSNFMLQCYRVVFCLMCTFFATIQVIDDDVSNRNFTPVIPACQIVMLWEKVYNFLLWWRIYGATYLLPNLERVKKEWWKL